MPVEAAILAKAPVPITKCPHCGTEPFEPFLRGQVQRHPRRWIIGPKRPYCALICWNCKEIVGYE